MAIKESALALITSITQSDLIRAVTAAGASRRITVANLAKAIVENYTGSSLAGSNRSVKEALDSLNSKSMYRAGDSLKIQTVFTGKGVNALDGYYGAIILPRAVANGVSITLSEVAEYGKYFSDGLTPTLDLSGITQISAVHNALWFKLPATGVTKSNCFAWIRFEASITFS